MGLFPKKREGRKAPLLPTLRQTRPDRGRAPTANPGNLRVPFATIDFN
jgi:hypothetical protein